MAFLKKLSIFSSPKNKEKKVKEKTIEYQMIKMNQMKRRQKIFDHQLTDSGKNTSENYDIYVSNYFPYSRYSVLSMSTW